MVRITEQQILDLRDYRDLPDAEMEALLETSEWDARLREEADRVRQAHYGTDVYVRGLIEFTNHCKNNCYYCGIRAGNTAVERYRLTPEEIYECCREGYALGFRTFVLQGGEDAGYTDADISEIVYTIKSRYPDCAVTLSVGEKSRATYEAWFRAGADRYLLRHETASDTLYRKWHPETMSLANRKRCLYDLKEIGYQVGAGFMVGAPYQTTKDLITDLRFLQDLEPDMIGIGPFLTHHETPFADFPNGDFALTVRLLSVLRLLFPYVLLPATTALGTIAPDGREQGLKAGANVIMPNLSPVSVRKLYELYEHKICTGEEAAQCRGCLERRVQFAGYQVVTDIGNVKR